MNKEIDVSEYDRLSKTQRAELLRVKVDTIGQKNKPGEQIQNVISVGMLSEGWDAKTVTHIMGLRAFSSQLLCEQVVGRGLRRTSYDVNSETGLLEPEYVNIFGVPFTFLPHESQEGVIPEPTKPKTVIEPDESKSMFEIRWPNVIRIDRTIQPILSLDFRNIDVLELDAAKTSQLAELAPIIDGKPSVLDIKEIDLENLAKEFRSQRIAFETAADVFEQAENNWKGRREYLLAQVVRLVQDFIDSDKVFVTPSLFNNDEIKRRLVVTLNMTKLVQHIWDAIRLENTEKRNLVLDRDAPIRSTRDMRTWYTSKPCEYGAKSHINYCVLDSSWESSDVFAFERSRNVTAWVKNDHLGFEILYMHEGIVRKYIPDFIVRTESGDHLVVETKGLENSETSAKWRALQEWIRAVNINGSFGRWSCVMTRSPKEIHDALVKV